MIKCMGMASILGPTENNMKEIGRMASTTEKEFTESKAHLKGKESGRMERGLSGFNESNFNTFKASIYFGFTFS